MRAWPLVGLLALTGANVNPNVPSAVGYSITGNQAQGVGYGCETWTNGCTICTSTTGAVLTSNCTIGTTGWFAPFIDAGCIEMNGVVRCSWETGQADVLLNVGGLGNVSGIYQTFFHPRICAAPWPTPPCLCGAGAYGYGTCPSDGGIPHGFLGVGPNDHCSASVLAVVNDGGLGYSSMLQASASPSDNDAGLVANGISVSFVNWTTTSFMPGSTNLLGEVQCTQSN